MSGPRQKMARRREASATLRQAFMCSVLRPEHARGLANSVVGVARELEDRLLEAEALLCAGYSLARGVDPATRWQTLQLAERIFRVNDRLDDAARSRAASARALYDMGRERQAIACAHSALEEPHLPGWDRAYAHALLFDAYGRLGRITEAYAHLNEHALPLARACREPYLIAYVLNRKAWLFARVIHSAQNEKLRLPALAETTCLGPGRLDWSYVDSLFDAAEAALPAGGVSPSLLIERHYALGLTRETGAALRAARRLQILAGQATEQDPAAAAWGHLCRAMVLHDARDVEGALEALPPALELAERCGLSMLTRDLNYFQSLCMESAGRTSEALAALRQYVQLTRRSQAAEETSGAVGPPVALPPTHAAVVPLHRLRSIEPAYLKRAVRLVEQHLGTPVTTAQIAAGCGVSRRTLDAAFLAARAVTLSGYLRGKVFEFAAEQLLRTTRPVRDISQAAGYRSPTMFAREFRKRFGVTPSQWRETATVA